MTLRKIEEQARTDASDPSSCWFADPRAPPDVVLSRESALQSIEKSASNIVAASAPLSALPAPTPGDQPPVSQSVGKSSPAPPPAPPAPPPASPAAAPPMPPPSPPPPPPPGVLWDVGNRLSEVAFFAKYAEKTVLPTPSEGREPGRDAEDSARLRHTRIREKFVAAAQLSGVDLPPGLLNDATPEALEAEWARLLMPRTDLDEYSTVHPPGPGSAPNA